MGVLMTGWGLDTLFNPSKRHMDEEKQRLQSTREEVGDNSGGERIDLGTGKVVIKRKPDAEALETADPAESTTPDASTAEGRAQLRRAARRRRDAPAD